MEVERIIVGNLKENCYILVKGNSCLIVDPGDEFLRIKEKISDKKVEGILLTHHHFDHIGALQEVLAFSKTEVYDFSNLKEQVYEIGPFTFQVIYNPGHTMDSISFYFEQEKIMFVGDFLFLENIGRCDLEGGNFSLMKESIEKIKKYPDSITIYPGHGSKTTLEHEKKYNHYF